MTACSHIREDSRENPLSVRSFPSEFQILTTSLLNDPQSKVRRDASLAGGEFFHKTLGLMFCNFTDKVARWQSGFDKFCKTVKSFRSSLQELQGPQFEIGQN